MKVWFDYNKDGKITDICAGEIVQYNGENEPTFKAFAEMNYEEMIKLKNKYYINGKIIDKPNK